jgi:hypothetical protein
MSLFAARRKAKRPVRTDSEHEEDEDSLVSGPVVRRPQTKSKLRVSFNPGAADDDGSNDSATAVKRATKDDVSLPQKTARLGLSNILRRTDAEADEGQDHDRPRYNKAYLDELRNSTPSTPHDPSTRASPSRDLIQTSENLELDLESKFGKLPATSIASQSYIPSATEIQEKKERRARLAKEQVANAYTATTSTAGAGDDFISLEAYDSDGEFRPQRMQVGHYLAPAREKDTRLIHEDEEIAEGFDEFTEDTGRVTLSKKGLREQSRRERENIRAMINAAEDTGSENSNDDGSTDSDDSDHALRHQYDISQTHHALDGLSAHNSTTQQLSRPRQPSHITPIPKLSAGLSRLREIVSALEFERARVVKRQTDMQREMSENREAQEHIQKSLEEAGRELERLKEEHAAKNGVQTEEQGRVNGHGTAEGAEGNEKVLERGLETFG